MTVAPLYAGIGGKGVGGVEVEVVVGVGGEAQASTLEHSSLTPITPAVPAAAPT